MREYLVDTCVVSELMKSDPNEVVLDWLCEHSNETKMSVVTVKEMYYGALRMPEGKKRSRLLRGIENVVDFYDLDLIEFDRRMALEAARLHDEAERAGRPPTSEDLMIAATARCRGLVLVTRNVKDFDVYDIDIVNPFDL